MTFSTLPMTVLLAAVTPQVAQNLIELAFDIVPRVFGAIGILVLTRLAIGLVGRVMRRTLNRTEPTIRKFLVQASEIITLVVGISAALTALAIPTATLVTVVGAAGLAIGLALQNTLSHFAAGIMLITFRPFEVGDYVEGAGVFGVVDSIGLFYTTLVTRDNVKITVPNSNLFSGTLKNMTTLGTRRVDLEIDIGDRPIDSTITLLLALVLPHPLVLNDPKPTCHVHSVSPTTTILYLRPWCAAEAYEQVRSEIQQMVKETLQQPDPTPDPNTDPEAEITDY
ncbi:MULTISPECIES: mechanosensitive ion channel family protein [unclassified Trichocoleus]|uniref:mechanosensitive ion channel family protein n=1 Tax=unclassified Trichocoleus TaxID=2628910 RepID=UPI001F55649B|nr:MULTISPECIES: mechanosensitive ion channel family protein [unclassified Trichocoleus]